MNVLEEIFEELEERGNIQFSSYTKPLIAVEDVLEIIRSHVDEREVFKFDFNRVKSFDCQCGRHYVNTYNGGWIPVEEGLPEEGQDVLAQFVVRVVSIDNKVSETVYIYVLYYENGAWQSFAGVPNGKVEAWQPLPEPFKGRRE